MKMYILGLFMGVMIGIFLICMLQINREKKECLHCGKKAAAYCESCYQDLISENARLQAEIHLKKVETYKNKVKNPEMFVVEQHVPRLD